MNRNVSSIGASDLPMVTSQTDRLTKSLAGSDILSQSGGNITDWVDCCLWKLVYISGRSRVKLSLQPGKTKTWQVSTKSFCSEPFSVLSMANVCRRSIMKVAGCGFRLAPNMLTIGDNLIHSLS